MVPSDQLNRGDAVVGALFAVLHEVAIGNAVVLFSAVDLKLQPGVDIESPGGRFRLAEPGGAPLAIDIETGVPVAVIGMQHDRSKLDLRSGMREEEVAGAEFEMDREARNLVRSRHRLGDPVDGAGMLIEGGVEQVADGGVVHADVET